ncbi:uncharacterized protein LOC114863986 [Betta splendens]|uniref:Uncharacterized protein LOC114863986 n=1 Tax=Betta splendens TaxID=158456 RepID=A0A9W2Y3B2_BETSP|nr:uncharacterized protein LOC114863986 [Betta splendens]
METVVVMMVVLGLCHGVETYCDGRQNGTQCYGALGGTVDVQLMDRDSRIYRYWWKKDQRLILGGRMDQILSNHIENRSVFTPSNGTIRIINLSRNDSGEYQLELYDSNGQKSEERTLHLTVQAPVGSVLLLSECLSEGQMRASCSSEGGDSPQYSWTLDGHTLTHAELLSGNNETNNITLKQHVSGRLLCSVRNQVSRVSREETITDCGFIFINCTSFNGTYISQSVSAANNTLCVEPTTHPTTVTEAHVSTVGNGGERTQMHGARTRETYCDGRQDRAQCYGALGGTVDVQLMDRASDVHKYQWIKDQRVILGGRRDRFLSNPLEDRFLFTPSNGTIRINNLSRNDSGEYQIELYDSEGKNKKRTLHLTIQAPVGSVLLLSECLSEGQMRASCSSEGGDSPQYSWTLDGHTLTHAELLSGNNETNNITLKQHVSGRLLCSVRNQVNNVSKEETITDCGFIFINCTSPNGTHMSRWVFAANNNPCVEPTAHPTTVTEAHVSVVETYCDGRQDRAQCYGALGGTVDVQLMDRASDVHKYQWIKDQRVILGGRRDRFLSNHIEVRSLFTPSNGTIRINNLSRNDSGEYQLETYDSDGRRLDQRTLSLIVQAPVGSVLLLSECLSEGQMRASCSSEGGDSPQYSWTLDGHTLTHAELLSGNNESNNITLKQHVSGRLLCSVRNQVSRVSKEESISPCKGLSLLICGLESAVAAVSLGVICIYFYWKKRKYEQLSAPATQTIELI